MVLQKPAPRGSVLPHPYSPISRKKVVVTELHPRSSPKTSNSRGSTGTTRQRILLSIISRQEEVRRPSSGSRPKEPQQVHQSGVIQDGELAVYPAGYKGRLPAYSDPRGIPEIPTILGGSGALPVSKPSLWHLISPQNIHEGATTSNSFFEGERSKGPPLPGRHPPPLKQPGITRPTSRDPGFHPNEFRMDNQLAEKQHPTYPKDGLPGSRTGHPSEHSGVTKGEIVPTHSESERGYPSVMSAGQSIPQPPRFPISNHSNGQMGAMEYQTPTSLLPAPVGRMVHVPIDSHPRGSQAIFTVVDPPRQPQQVQADSHPPPGGSNFRRQSGRMGGTLPTLCSSGPLALQNQGCSIEHPRDEGSLPSPLGIQFTPERETSPHSNGQPSGGSLYQQAGGYQEHLHDAGSRSGDAMGSTEPVGPEGDLYSGGSELTGGLPQQNIRFQQRVVSKPTGLCPHMPDMGSSRHRPRSNTREQEVSEVSVEESLPHSGGYGLSPARLELSPRLHFSTNPTDSQVPSEAQTLNSSSTSRDSLLATEALVHHPPATEHSGSTSTPGNNGSTNPGPATTSESREIAPSGLETERSRFLEQGCSQKVVDTLLQARKSSTNSTYERIWERFSSFAQEQGWDPSSPSAVQVLEFLQSGLDKGLRSNTLKVQVSAISALTGVRWALNPLVVQFQKACLKLRPPRKPSFPTWDLSTVLEVLSGEPFFPLENTSLWDLTLKVSFLIAITSAKRVSEMQALLIKEPYLMVYPDRLTLKPSDRFIPKVSSAFHFNQEIDLPALITDQGVPHPLDVKGNILHYLSVTKPFRKCENLLVIPHGFRKGQAASARTIASWLVKAIKKAYSLSTLQIPGDLRAHSTRAMATSWAAYCKVSAETICRAATWSSRNTFISHYRIDAARLAAVEFGRAVIQANSSVSCQ